MRSRALMVVGLGMIVLGWPLPVFAVLDLSFSQATYNVGVGQTVSVPVFVSQVPGGPQVGLNNGLLTADILVSFNNPPGIAAVLLPANVWKGPAFDSFSAGVSPTTATLAETSLSGIGDLSSPLLLGTFVFAGQGFGTTTISVRALDPSSADFITTGNNVVDPTNTATATINVDIPEPSPLMIWFLLVSLGIVLGGWQHRRTTSVYSSRSA